MSINYICNLDTGAGVDEIVSLIHALIGGAVETEGEHVFVVTAAVVAQVESVTDSRSRQWFLQDWGLDPKIEVSFNLNTSAPEVEYLAGRRDFSIASVRLGEDLDVDAVLRFEADRLMMRRQDGALTLYDWWPDWADPKTIAALPPGYILIDGGYGTPQEPESDT